MDQYVPCPSCGSDQAKKVGFSWWGGVLGPKLFKHVKCPNCGTTFNGRTGKSNNTAIAIYLVVGGVIGVVVMILVILALT